MTKFERESIRQDLFFTKNNLFLIIIVTKKETDWSHFIFEALNSGMMTEQILQPFMTTIRKGKEKT